MAVSHDRAQQYNNRTASIHSLTAKDTDMYIYLSSGDLRTSIMLSLSTPALPSKAAHRGLHHKHLRFCY